MNQSNDSGLNLDHLEALARAATPGRWMRLFGERTVYDRMEDGCRGNAIVRADLGYGLRDISNLDFIAAASPAAVLELIALARCTALANQPAPTVPAGDALAQLTKERDGWKDEAAHQKALYERACDSVEMLRDHERAHFWIWQGDGTDNLNSMTDSMTVLMRADNLRALAALTHAEGLSFGKRRRDDQAREIAGLRTALAHQPAQEQAVPFSPTDQQYADWCDRHDLPPHQSRDAFDDAASLYPAAQQEPVAAPKEIFNGDGNA